MGSLFEPHVRIVSEPLTIISHAARNRLAVGGPFSDVAWHDLIAAGHQALELLAGG
ncbi:hypothetical protein [Nitratireductor soli]|uniref:hypothetical protein n=1 Tax=Nitratireductor soli TaxID=1670619 RepID=UPI000A952B45|nr:hypothetical protein [Nitratireductor soli]